MSACRASMSAGQHTVHLFGSETEETPSTVAIPRTPLKPTLQVAISVAHLTSIERTTPSHIFCLWRPSRSQFYARPWLL